MTDEDLGSARTAADTQPSTLDVPAPTPTTIADRYQILGLLGAGGMGRVYRAHDRSLDEIVALKLLRREMFDRGGIERFRQEVKLARRVTSTHVVRTFDLGEHGDDHFLTMEYIDGRSLAQLLDDGPPPLDEVVRIARAVAAGMAAAHANGVLHRDLKPDNVLVARSGRIVITDFGIARPSASTANHDEFVGTPAYMAPEQVESAAVGPPADVYAFGAIVFEMLTGRRAFVGSDPLRVAFARLREPPPDPRALRPVPDALAALTLRCLARAPADRFADGDALGAALATLHDVSTARVSAKSPAALPAKTSRSVAILPLQATGELVEIADGLTEEIVDALSMTRELRVRPLATVRKAAATADVDTRVVGQALDVDVVVDGSIRRRGDRLRIAARAIGVADGFQLWASHFDAGAEGLLSAGDELVRAVAGALTVELALPDRAPATDPRATAIYLECKAKLRATWMTGGYDRIIGDLDRARTLAPGDAGILATLALAQARAVFYGVDGTLDTAQMLADRAVELAPASGEAWLAVALSRLYSNQVPAAAAALVRALTRAPGFASAQANLGAMLLDAGALDNAIAHLEAAQSLDPDGTHHIHLPRAYVYAGRWDDAMRELDRTRTDPNGFGNRLFDEISTARFRMWRGERHVMVLPQSDVPSTLRHYVEVAERIHRSGTLSREDHDALVEQLASGNARLRSSRCQFLAEFTMYAGDHDNAMNLVGMAVDAGLQDHTWMEHCPMLAPLRTLPRFAELAAQVAARARAVIATVTAELAS